MKCHRPEHPELSNRAYRYLVLVELLLTIVALALSIVNAVGGA